MKKDGPSIEPSNKRIDLAKSVLATEATAFAGHPRCWADRRGVGT
jgi:hypothetical protein